MLVADHPIADASLRSELDRAQADRQRLFETALAQAEQKTVTPPATPAVAETTAPPPSPAPAAQPPAAPSPVMASPTAPSPVPSTVAPKPAAPAVPAVVPAAAPVAALPRLNLHIERSNAPLTGERGQVTDEEIGVAIQKGVDFLIERFGKEYRVDGEAGRRNGYTSGMDALAVYALIDRLRAAHPGVEIESWNVVMGIGQIVVLRTPPHLVPVVNVEIERSAWGVFTTECYPTYDFVPVRERIAREWKAKRDAAAVTP